jgi:hypothetical protein
VLYTLIKTKKLEKKIINFNVIHAFSQKILVITFYLMNNEKIQTDLKINPFLGKQNFFVANSIYFYTGLVLFNMKDVEILQKQTNHLITFCLTSTNKTFRVIWCFLRSG